MLSLVTRPRFENNGFTSAGRPPTAFRGWEVLSRATGHVCETDFEEVRITRLVGWRVSRIVSASASVT